MRLWRWRCAADLNARIIALLIRLKERIEHARALIHFTVFHSIFNLLS